MELNLPKKINEQELISIASKNIVVIGANGSSKIRFGRDIEERYDKITHRISAQKSLSMPKGVINPRKNAMASLCNRECRNTVGRT